MPSHSEAQLGTTQSASLMPRSLYSVRRERGRRVGDYQRKHSRRAGSHARHGVSIGNEGRFRFETRALQKTSD